MNNSEFAKRSCETCGEPKNELRADGVEILLRCTCDWEAEFYQRLRETVHPDFWRLNISNWRPFENVGHGKFGELIRIQRAIGVNKLYDFCFKKLGTAHSSLHESIRRGRILYIRGPLHSGRGTLLGLIKKFCAVHDISTTPSPYAWSQFKSDVLASEWNGREAEEAKARVAERYQSVKVLTLEGVKGEGQLLSGERAILRRPFRASNMVDSILTGRAFRPGCMVFTSDEFFKEIGDTVGDKLPDLLESDLTTTIMLFSPDEATALYNALSRRMSTLRAEADALQVKDGKETLQNRLSMERVLESVKECLILDKMFASVSPAGSDPLSQKVLFNPEKYPKEVLQLFAEFNAPDFESTLSFKDGATKAYQSVVSSCKELSFKMTPREMTEIGEMMKDACGPNLESIIKDSAAKEHLIMTEKLND